MIKHIPGMPWVSFTPFAAFTVKILYVCVEFVLNRDIAEPLLICSLPSRSSQSIQDFASVIGLKVQGLGEPVAPIAAPQYKVAHVGHTHTQKVPIIVENNTLSP